MIQQGSRLDYHLISFLLQISQYLSPEMEKFPSFLGLKVWDFSSANFCLLRPICIPYKLIKYFTYSTQKFFKWRFEKQEQYRFTILFFYFFFHVTLLESALPLIGIQQKKKKMLLMNFLLQSNLGVGGNFHSALTSTGLPLVIAQIRRFLFYIFLLFYVITSAGKQ